MLILRLTCFQRVTALGTEVLDMSTEEGQQGWHTLPQLHTLTALVPNLRTLRATTLWNVLGCPRIGTRCPRAEEPHQHLTLVQLCPCTSLLSHPKPAHSLLSRLLV